MYPRDKVRYPCDQCDYAGTKPSNLKRHKEIKHEGIRYPSQIYDSSKTPKIRRSIVGKIDGEDSYRCEYCDYKGSRAAVYKHSKSKHEGVRYPCDQCNYAANQLAHLKKHKENIHEGIRYPCTQCTYLATTQAYLKQHIESKHEGIVYPCDQCEFACTKRSNLKRHKENKHEGIRYPCNECDYAG